MPVDAAWAPDGRIAYSGADRVIVAAPDGLEPRPIAFGSQPSWSPDGDIVFVPASWLGSGQLAVVSDDGSTLRRLPSLSRRVAAPAWSPTGDAIAYIGFASDSAAAARSTC
jgi:Tol biopolymer transport system component